MPLLTAADIQASLLFDLTDDEIALIDNVLEPAAEADMVGYLRRPIVTSVPTTDVIPVDLRPPWDEPLRIYPLSTPIVSVTTVTVLSDPPTVLQPRDFVVRKNYIEVLILLGPTEGLVSLNTGVVNFQIDYIAGLPTEVTALVVNCLNDRLVREIGEARALAIRTKGGLDGVQRMSVEGYLVDYRLRAAGEDPDFQNGYLGLELTRVRDWRRRIIR